MPDGGQAAIAENTSHQGSGLPLYIRLLSLPHMEVEGKTLYQWHAQEGVLR